MLIRRSLSHFRGANWFHVFLDFLVVVMGLFIAFQVDRWWEGRNDVRIEDSYLLEIREDFAANQSRLTNTMAGLEEITRAMLELHQQSALATPNMSATELNERFRSITFMPLFTPVNRAYINITGSGDLKLIQSRPLKNALAEYYAMTEEVVLIQDTHEMELVQTFQPYIIENLDYAAIYNNVEAFSAPPTIEESRILDLLITRQFRNIVAQKWLISADLLGQNRRMLKRTNDIIGLLEQRGREEVSEAKQ